jgi:MFS family permease
MDEEQRANVRRCVVGEGLYGSGVGLVAVMTALPLLLEGLGAGRTWQGLAFGIGTAGWVITQPVGLFLLGRRRRMKRFLLPWSFTCSVPPYLLLAALVCLLGMERPELCVPLVIAVLGVRFLGEGMIVAFWMDWQATVFPRAIRGRTVGLVAAASAVGFGLSAIVSSCVRADVPFPYDYALLFLLSAVLCGSAVTSFARVREPELRPAEYRGHSLPEVFSRFGRSLGDRNFRSYLVARILLTLGAGGSAFYAVHFTSTEGGQVGESTVIALGIFITFPQAVSGYLLGRLGDRRGHKLGAVVGATGQALSIAVAFLGRGPVTCAAAFALLGVAFAGGWVSHSNMLYETCPHDSRVAHITAANVVLGPLVLVVPLVTGWVMEALTTTRTGIGLTLVPTLAGVLWLALTVREPRAIELWPETVGSAQPPDEGS